MALKFSILQLISEGEPLVLAVCDGQQIIAAAVEVFKGGIDLNFRNWDLGKAGSATPETLVAVYEMKRIDVAFDEMFEWFGRDLSDLCLTEGQILDFVTSHRGWLREDGLATLFLLEVEHEFFVVRLFVSGSYLGVQVHRFADSYVWDARSHHRVVVPNI